MKSLEIKLIGAESLLKLVLNESGRPDSSRRYFLIPSFSNIVGDYEGESPNIKYFSTNSKSYTDRDVEYNVIGSPDGVSFSDSKDLSPTKKNGLPYYGTISISSFNILMAVSVLASSSDGNTLVLCAGSDQSNSRDFSIYEIEMTFDELVAYLEAP